MPKRRISAASPEASCADEPSTPPKPVPSFNGALAKFAFATPASRQKKPATAPAVAITPSSRVLRSLASPLKPSASPPSRSSSSPKPKKKRARHGGYAPPSKYAYLSGIPDVFAPGLICVFVGTNPGIKTAVTGHAYSAPSNLFWKLLHQSRLTPDMKRPATDDLKLCELYSLGNTNLVSRPTKNQAELSLSEMEDGVPVLEGKIRKWKPEAVCIVGKGIWERVYNVKAGRKLKNDEFRFGWQEGWKFGEDPEEGWEGARVFVAISTSGLVAGYSMQQKLEVMTELGDWVNERRHDRGETAPRGLPDEAVEKAARGREESFRESLVEWEKQVKVEPEGADSEGKLEDGKVKIKTEEGW